MKKLISTVLVSSLLLSSSAFASPQALSEIMSNYNERAARDGAPIATVRMTEDLGKSNISQAELLAYLEAEMSPKNFKKVSTSLSQGMTFSEIPGLMKEISNGAAFKGDACVNLFTTVGIVSGITAAVVALIALSAKTQAGDERDAAEDLIVPQSFNSNANDSSILELQLSITALQNEGVSSTSYFVTDMQAEIARIQLNTAQREESTSLQNEANSREATKKVKNADSLDEQAKTGFTIAGIAAGVAVASIATGYACGE